MFRIENTDGGNLIIETETHYYASAEVEVFDNRKESMYPENYTLFFEVKKRSIDEAKFQVDYILKQLGYTRAVISNVFITELGIDAGKFWVLGKQKEKE